jgi:hypothetical protein
MGMTLKSGSFLHRRSLLQDGAAVGAGLLGLDLLAACGSPTTTSGVVTPSNCPGTTAGRSSSRQEPAPCLCLARLFS